MKELQKEIIRHKRMYRRSEMPGYKDVIYTGTWLSMIDATFSTLLGINEIVAIEFNYWKAVMIINGLLSESEIKAANELIQYRKVVGVCVQVLVYDNTQFEEMKKLKTGKYLEYAGTKE